MEERGVDALANATEEERRDAKLRAEREAASSSQAQGSFPGAEEPSNDPPIDALVQARPSRQHRKPAALLKPTKVKKGKEKHCAEKKEVVGCLPFQGKLKHVYQMPECENFVAVVIIANFFTGMLEATLLPKEGDDIFGVFKATEYIFNAIFLVELIVNMYGSWFLEFWMSAWNLFDFVVVVMACVAMFNKDIPGISTLRAFRVFRLFRRVESLRIIMIGIAKSLPGVVNAFILLALIMGIWSIVGVEFFADDFPDEFGNFGKAMLSMLQMATFDSWVSGITRPVCLFYSDQWYTFLYFVSYAFMSGIIMQNVVIAILVERFLNASQEVRDENEEAKKEESKAQAVLKIQRAQRSRRLQTAVRRVIKARRRRLAAIRVQKWIRGTQVRRRHQGQQSASEPPRDECEEKRSASDAQDAAFRAEQESRDATHSMATRLSKLEAHADIWQEDVERSVDLIMSHLGIPFHQQEERVPFPPETSLTSPSPPSQSNMRL